MKQRFSRKFNWWRFILEIDENINRQCVGFGFSVNWNYRPSVEVWLLFWCAHLEYVKPKRSA